MFPGGDSGIGSVQFESFGLLAEFAALGCSEIAECTSDHRHHLNENSVAQTAEPAVLEQAQVVVQQPDARRNPSNQYAMSEGALPTDE